MNAFNQNRVLPSSSSLARVACRSLLATFLLLVASQVGAVPAAPRMHTLQQANGERFQARQWGDETLHGWEDKHGFTIVFNQTRKNWHYASPGRAGEFRDSGIVVRGMQPGAPPELTGPGDRPSNLPVDVPRHFRPRPVHEREAPRFAPTDLTGLAADVSSLAASSALGTANVPIILVNFNNTSTTHTPAQFNTLLFGTAAGAYSMKQYYEEVSHGLFTVSPGPNGIAGWYTASRGHDYYGANQGSTEPLPGFDRHPGSLVYEALQAADTRLNFADFSVNANCTLVLPVMLVHQGDGEEAGTGANHIWSQSWSLSAASYWDTTVPGVYISNDACPLGGKVKVDHFTIQPERYAGGISTIGVFAHELAHGLGLLDLYDYDYDSSGAGMWSVMAVGCWNGLARSGDRPAHMDPWSKYFLGWVAPTRVTATLASRVIRPAGTAADVYQMGAGDPISASGEYFLVENRQRVGFDAGLPGAGLMVWHVDESAAGNQQQCYPGGPSCVEQHYKVAVVQADNLWELEKNLDSGDGGDPFPGTANKTAFSRFTAPNSNWYSGSANNVSVTGIRSNGDSTMSATLSMAAPLPDFTISAISLTPTIPAANGIYSARVTVRNQGNQSGNGGRLSVWSNQAASRVCGATGNKSVTVGTLTAGQSKAFTFTGLASGAAGTKSFRAFVDSACVTAESNEANNQSVKTYSVK